MLLPARIQQYQLFPSGRTEQLLKIVPEYQLEHPRDPNQVLANYRFSGIRRGIKPLRRLLSKVLSDKLGQKTRWDKSFWKNILVMPISCQLLMRANGIPISQLDGAEFAAFRYSVFESLSPRRRFKIQKYTQLMAQDIDLGFPVFVTGAALDHIGGNAQNQHIFMLDGARRIVASALNRNDNLKIWLLENRASYAEYEHPECQLDDEDLNG